MRERMKTPDYCSCNLHFVGVYKIKLRLCLFQVEVLSRHRKSCLKHKVYIQTSFLGLKSLGVNSCSLLAEVGSCSPRCFNSKSNAVFETFFGEATHS